MGFTTDLMTGLALNLQAADIGTWRANGAYQAAETGIVLRVLPDQPDRVICLATYGVNDAPVEGMDTIGLQVRTRWEGVDPRDGDNLADDIFEHWHSAHDVTLPGGVFVKQILRRSAVSGGIAGTGSLDGARRWVTVQNFYLQLPRITANRPE